MTREKIKNKNIQQYNKRVEKVIKKAAKRAEVLLKRNKEITINPSLY